MPYKRISSFLLLFLIFNSISFADLTIIPPPPKVIVSDEVLNTWKAIKLGIEDKDKGTKIYYDIRIGEEIKIPDSDLKIKVLVFLPDFFMNESSIASKSNEPANQAVQLSVSEEETKIFHGWYFQKHPDTDALNHPKYHLMLIEGIK